MVKKHPSVLLVGSVKVRPAAMPPSVSSLNFFRPARMSAEVGIPVAPLSFTASWNISPETQASVAVSGSCTLLLLRLRDGAYCFMAPLKSLIAGAVENQGRVGALVNAPLNADDAR